MTGPTQNASTQAEHFGLLVSVFGSLIVGVAGVSFYFLTQAEAILLDGLFNVTYFVTGLFTMKVAKLVQRGENNDFPVGFAFFEPLVNGGKGVLMLLVTGMALISSVKALFNGGRNIELGMAVVYGVVAAVVCWGVALIIRVSARKSGSPLVQADAKNWIVNAAVSSGVLATLAVVLFIRETSLRPFVPYVDPVLVLLLCSVTIGVPIRLAWNSMMELLNRTPSPDLLARVKRTIEESLSELPVKQLTVRVIQPGRTRIITGHVLLPSEFNFELEKLDAIRATADEALKQDHSACVIDLLFTGDPRWGAPLAESKPTN